MRVFISQPMRGKTDEEIYAERKPLVARLTAAGHEVVNPDLPDRLSVGRDVQNLPLYCMATGLAEIARCDAVVFTEDWSDARGCHAEHALCEAYGVPIIHAEGQGFSGPEGE